MPRILYGASDAAVVERGGGGECKACFAAVHKAWVGAEGWCGLGQKGACRGRWRCCLTMMS